MESERIQNALQAIDDEFIDWSRRHDWGTDAWSALDSYRSNVKVRVARALSAPAPPSACEGCARWEQQWSELREWLSARIEEQNCICHWAFRDAFKRMNAISDRLMPAEPAVTGEGKPE